MLTGYHSSNHLSKLCLTYLRHIPCDVGDDLVLLADVDKHGATDLVKLLNR